MDLPWMAPKARNESDVSDFDTRSRPSSSIPQDRPSHGRVHRRHRSHHHGASPNRSETQDLPDSAVPRRSPHRGRALSASPDTDVSHHTYDTLDHEQRRGSRRHHGRPHHRRQSHQRAGAHQEEEPSYRKVSDQDTDASELRGPRYHDASDHSRHLHRPSHHRRRPLRPGDTPSHRMGLYPEYTREHHPRRHRERHHRHDDDPYSDLLSWEDQRASSRDFGLSTAHSVGRVGSALYSSVVPKQSVALSLTHPPSALKSSSKVQPQDFSVKTSESEPEDGPFQKHRSRVTRVHKKLHSMNLGSMMCGKLCHLFHGLQRMLSVLTESLVFDAFIFIVVCLNIIMLVAQTFAEVEVRGEWYFVAFDSIFLCIYVVEAMLKIITMGLDYFYDPWNNLDFFIMGMAALEFALVQFNSRSFKRTVYNPNFFRIFKVFKSLRALRAIRILRRLSFLTSLQEVTGTLVRSMPSITAILVLMFTCLFLFSVVLRALFRHSDPKRFQNIFTTIFTLFTLLTLDDWSQIYVDSRAQGAWYIIPILMIYIIIQYFIFLNLVIAVLVDNFQMALLRGLEKMKQRKAALIHERLLAESLTDLDKAEPKEVLSEHAKQKLLIEKKFGTMTEKQQELLFHYLQLTTGVEHFQQKFRSQASVIDEIVDTAFEAGEEDFRK